ncbi:hypothetical protein CC78DRAFT_183466 [Lojkania enalia]|uniref:Uncharacterized protein n=1 Tax=Lojkania enalia TaxID=147567 RepID=A0A9P4N544_9PLEO|nr:hypothetical protein CC78DRAFT_183466 [Didymosphaeria enalia]
MMVEWKSGEVSLSKGSLGVEVHRRVSGFMEPFSELAADHVRNVTVNNNGTNTACKILSSNELKSTDIDTSFIEKEDDVFCHYSAVRFIMKTSSFRCMPIPLRTPSQKRIASLVRRSTNAGLIEFNDGASKEISRTALALFPQFAPASDTARKLSL